MPLPASRSVVLISGLLTLLVLGGGTLAVALHNGWLRTASADVPSRETVTASAQPVPTPNDQAAAARLAEPTPAVPTQGAIQDEVGYRRKLEEAYRALDDAYAQIRALQSPQNQIASARNDDDGFTEHDGDDDRRGRRFDRRRSHDD